MFQHDLSLDLDVLTLSLWIISRYWMDCLRDSEGLQQITRSDQERGTQQHFTVLLPCLTAFAKGDFKAALNSLLAPSNAHLARSNYDQACEELAAAKARNPSRACNACPKHP